MNNIVLDANLIAALLIRLPYSDAADTRFRLWRKQQRTFYVPAICPAEVITALRKMIVFGQISVADAHTAIEILEKLSIQIVTPTSELLISSLFWAERTGQTAAYDAQYLALAESLGAEMWTADQRLYHALKNSVSWLHWINE